MKSDIHPKYVKSKVVCSCGEVFLTRSTAPEIKIEICSKCHPFYTGKQKFIDSGGRVERFQKKFGNLLEQKEARGEGQEAKPEGKTRSEKVKETVKVENMEKVEKQEVEAEAQKETVEVEKTEEATKQETEQKPEEKKEESAEETNQENT